MSYTITLCDRSFMNITNAGITIEATTPYPGGIVLDTQSNGTIGGRYGATLSFAPSRQRFNIEINAPGTGYAPLVLPDLNGDLIPHTINVILLPIPPSFSGSSPTTTAAVRPFIESQDWTPDQMGAVFSTITSLCILKGIPGSEHRDIRRAA